jgi:hypothetical protein
MKKSSIRHAGSFVGETCIEFHVTICYYKWPKTGSFGLPQTPKNKIQSDVLAGILLKIAL